MQQMIVGISEMLKEGTWVIDEVRVAVDKGYRILEIEVYEQSHAIRSGEG
jgi:hypothetical protein